MPASKLLFSRSVYTCMALLVLAVMTILLFRIDDTYHVCLLLLAGGLAWVGVMPFRQWTLIDSMLCLVTTYELVACGWAACLAPAIPAAFYSVFGLTVYFILRRISVNDYAFRLIREGSYLPIGVALLLAIGSFFVFRNSVLNVGFADTYHFRFLFRPIGYITNVWAEVLLILLGWICLVRRYTTVFIFLCIQCILLSFSRGAYIALSIYLLSGLLWIRPRQEKIRLLAISIAAIALTAYLFPKEIKTTLQMNRTVSQQQSTEGRIDATQAAWNAFCEHPLLGYGSNNFVYAIDHAMNQDSTRPYTSFAPNIIVQLLVEKGAFGIMLYVLLALSVWHFIWKHWQRTESRTMACILPALLVKDMTQATLLCMPFTLFMLYVLLAFLQKEKTAQEENVERKAASYILPGVALVCFVVWNVPALRSAGATPICVSKAFKEMECYKIDGKFQHLKDAEKALDKAAGRHPEDVQITYLRARVYLCGEEIDKAETLLKRLVTAYPKNSLYLVALSDAQYRQGKKEKALQSFVHAVRFTPRLLTNERIRIWQQEDILFYQELLHALSALKPGPGDSPSDYARYGYIACWCDNPSADEYLGKAVAALPNLATPWRLLGDENKYRLLLYGAFHKDLLSLELPLEEEMTDDLLFSRFYQAKFENWYGSEWGFPI